MKKVFIVLALFMTYVCFSQKKIEGIGVFKLGKTTISVIDSLSKKAYKLKSCSNNLECLDYYIREKYICELVYNDKQFKKDVAEDTSIDGYFPLVRDNRVFIISNYEVAGIEIKEIKLFFYKNALYKILLDSNSSLQDALRLKYNIKENTFEKEGSCNLFKDLYSISEYRNDDMFAQTKLQSLYDTSCDNSVSTINEFYIKEVNATVTSLELIENQKYNERLKEAKNVKLNKL